MFIAALALTSAMVAPRTTHAHLQPAGVCLHEAATETQEQQARRARAVGLARTVNTAEAVFSAKSGIQSYADVAQLVANDLLKPAPASGQYIAGFDLHLDAMEKSYWFEVVDRTDPCGFRFISNQSGLIFTAEPIR